MGAAADGRGAAAAALAMLLVLPLGLSDGGYYGRSLMAVTLALATGAALALLRPDARRPSRALTAAVFALALLSAWVALSSLWAEPGAGVELETRRCILYALALLAVGAAAGGRRRAFLLALTTAVSTLAIVGIVMRVTSGVPVDPYYGSLLAEPWATRTRWVCSQPRRSCSRSVWTAGPESVPRKGYEVSHPF